MISLVLIKQSTTKRTYLGAPQLIVNMLSFSKMGMQNLNVKSVKSITV